MNATQSTRSRRLVWAISVVWLLAACAAPAQTPPPNGSPAPSGSPGSTAPPNQPGGSGAPTADVAPTDRPAVLPPTSEQLIGAALEAGTITYEESLLYRALALYDSPGLPDGFRSPVADMGAATELLAEVDAHEAELSAELLGQLAPYRVRPSDPTSIFNTSTPQTASLVGYPLTASGPVWADLPAAGGAARVWVEKTPGWEGRLRQHVEDVTNVWYAMTGVFTYPDPDLGELPSPAVNPDAAVDFYWIELIDVDPRRAECSANPAIDRCAFPDSAAGFAAPTEPRRVNASSAYFVLDAARGGDAGRFTIAHELAHGGQFHYDNRESTWLHEATANWVAYRVLQEMRLPPEPAYTWVRPLFERLDMPITTEADSGGYRAWLYFQFAAMEEGDGVVTRIWESAAKSGVQGEEAIDAVFPFEKHFADFALRNWNHEPVPRLYRTAPDLTFPTVAPRLRVQGQVLRAGDRASVEIALPRVASAYYSYTMDASSRKVTFKNPLVGVAGAHVWAIISIGEPGSGSDVVEDWAGVRERIFCLTRERVRGIVLVVSNGQIAPGSTLSGKIDIEPVAEGCGAGGLVTYNRTINKSVATDLAPCGRHTIDETTTVTISVAFDGNNKGTATVSDQGNSVEVSTSIDCNTGKTYTTTSTTSHHVVGTKDIFLFWWINAGVLDFNAVWEHVTGGTGLYELRCEPVSCDKTSVEDVTSLYISVAFKADVDPDAAVISGSKVEDASEEGVSDITTYTWTIER